MFSVEKQVCRFYYFRARQRHLMRSYLLNCFLLFIPILIWNILILGYLPEIFLSGISEKAVPDIISYGENISRILLFIIAFLMPIRLTMKKQKIGLLLYLIALFLYFISWLIVIDGRWNHHIFVFLSPAYTPAFWLFSFSLIGDSFSFNIPYYRWLYPVVSILFLFFHNARILALYFNFY